MSHNRWVFSAMPLRSGLATAGKRSTIDEQQLWVAQNCYPDLDGLVRTRPGTAQHGSQFTRLNPHTTATYSYNNATQGDVDEVVVPVRNGNAQVLVELDPVPAGGVAYTWSLFVGDIDDIEACALHSSSGCIGYEDDLTGCCVGTGVGPGEILDLPIGTYTCWIDADSMLDAGGDEYTWPAEWTYYVKTNEPFSAGIYRTIELESGATIEFDGTATAPSYPVVTGVLSYGIYFVFPSPAISDYYEIGYEVEPLLVELHYGRQTVTGVYNTVADEWEPTTTAYKQGAATLMTINGTDVLASPHQLTIATFTMTSAVTSFSGVIEYAAGPELYNSEGVTAFEAVASGTYNSVISIQGYRKSFWGADANVTNSADVRALPNYSSWWSTAGSTFAVGVTSGTTNIVFAYPDSLAPPTSVTPESDSEINVVPDCSVTVISVEGANSHAGIDYKVYTYTPTNTFSSPDIWRMTI